MPEQKRRKFTPLWAERAKSLGHKPDWQDKIPHRLWGLGEVFFPIPRGRKGWSYPHHMDDYRYPPDSEKLNAYLEAGFGYGIACAGDLAVVDIDEYNMIDELMGLLPETIYQWTGSGEGVHLFYLIEDLDRGINLTVSTQAESHAWAEGYDLLFSRGKHMGEIRSNEHQYVVGPGSLHPSGNIYGPLEGDDIARVDRDELLDLLDTFIVDSTAREGHLKAHQLEKEEYESPDVEPHPFYDLNADDVLPWLEPDKRIEHPVHGSDTNSNFKKNSDRQTFTCWRCSYGPSQGCGLNGRQFLALKKAGKSLGSHACERLRSRWNEDKTLHFKGWIQAVEDGLIDPDNPPYNAIVGYALERELYSDEDDIDREGFYQSREALLYEIRT